MNYFVRSGSLLGFAELVRELGQDPARLLREVGLSQGVMQSPDLYMPYRSLADVLRLAARRCNTPDFGVRLGSRQGLEVIGALGSCLCLQTSVGEALQLLQKNMDFHAQGLNVAISTSASTFAIHFAFAFADQADCEQLSALTLAQFVRGIAQLHSADLPPLETRLRLRQPNNTAAFEHALRSPVQFAQAENGLTYPLGLLEQPVAVERDRRSYLTQQWRSGWQRSAPVSLALQVERAIDALLPTGECNLTMVAKLVELHPRVLQQRLKAQGSSFAAALKTTRLKLAQYHLGNSTVDLTTLAMSLGFADLTAFSRAFKQWSGMSPRRWRQQAGKT
jgi:AraC-like DNA-binding protein